MPDQYDKIKSYYPPLLILFVVVFLAYLPSMNAPWYMDDSTQIFNNAKVQNFSLTAIDFFIQRGLVTLTFALNFHFFGMETFSFHVVNLLIHIMGTTFAFFCLIRVFRTGRHWPVIGAAIFALHPLQTQAVTYIVQRSTIMSALFLFITLYFYIRMVEEQASSGNPKKQIAFYILCFSFGALAVVTKQNTAPLPLLLILFDYFFLNRDEKFPWRRKFIFISPLFIVPVLNAISMVLLPYIGGENWQRISNFEQLYPEIGVTPLTYLATEFSVFWIYLRLLVLPINQVFDYGYPFASSLFSFKPLLALIGITGLLVLSGFMRRKWPCILFFLLWMIISLAVESSFFPLDPIFEHRLYIPLFGFSILITDVLIRISRINRRAALAISLALLAVFATLSYKRNNVWKTPLELYSNDVAHGYSSRSLILLAKHQYQQGQHELAKTNFDKYAARIEQIGLDQAGYQMIVNLAITSIYFNDWSKAERLLLLAVAKEPSSYYAHHNLAVTYAAQNKYPQALQHFTITLKLQPGNAKALFNYIKLSIQLKRDINYRVLLNELRRLDKDLAKKLRDKIPSSYL